MAERIGRLSLFALLLLQPLWHAVLAPPSMVPVWLVLVIAIVPLLGPVIAVLRGHRDALFWGALVSLLYFCHGVAEAWAAPSERHLALVQIALSLVLVACVGGSGLARRRASRRAGL
ncbi:MAG TPA: DUF2069 domain-containing protein [Xanthomonadaceae bacterium]|nr:DUF2069 domain-containing protein [Xanthomonadaceae bacterium]